MKKSLKKKNTPVLFLFRWFEAQDFSKIETKTLKKITSVIGILLLAAFLFVFFEIYIPINPISHETITYTVPKGWGDHDIAKDLEKLGIIRSDYFFRFYVIISLQYSSLQAGKYNLSPRMSTYKIVKKMVQGDVLKNKLVIPEGWDIKDIAEYLESKGICSKDDFIQLSNKDFSQEFDFLKDKPKNVGLEGYLFPDTYEVSEGQTCQDIIITMLANFEKKLTPELREQIINQEKSIFDIVTMASMIEKEVKTLEDKKIVSGILWKRLKIGMPLQIDATINYITGKNDPGVAIKDTKIDSPYNTYRYKGLPKGPISNPGIDSIAAALNPTDSPYWFYLSDGRTIFSKTLEEHNTAKAKYLGS